MNRFRLMSVSVLLLLCSASFIQAGTSGGLMDISADGHLLAVSNRDSGTVSIVDLRTLKKQSEIKVGTHPEGVSFLGDSHRVAVAVYDDDVLALVDADAGKLESKIEVFDEPYAVVSAPNGHLLVTLEYPGQVVEIDPAVGKIVREMAAGHHPRGLALTADGKRALVTGYLNAEVLALDLETGKVADRWEGADTDNLARQIVVHPRRPKAYFGSIRSKFTAHQGAGSIFPYVTVLNLAPQADDEDVRRRRIPMDSFIGALVTADTNEVAISPDGQRFYVTFGGTNDMFACDVVDDDYREIKLFRYVRLGNNPRGVKVSPDSRQVFVYDALDFEVVAFNASDMSVAARIPVTDNPLSEDVHLGKVLFYTALQPMTGQRWISCASCHPDGQPDGKTWHNPEGLRNTPPLGGLAFTHPQHWSADRDETQDFEHTIRGPLMQGRGLVRGPINVSLGKPNRGLSKDLDALAAYTNSHKVPLSPYAKHGLSDSAKRGRELFFSKETACASCHSGPFFTDSQSGKPSKRHDVGTGGDDPSEKMGPEYDTPMLLSLYRTAPYLHHGRAATLKDVLTTENRNDRHGKTSHLSAQQVDDLVEFLKSLPYENPEPAAEAAGIRRIAN